MKVSLTILFCLSGILLVSAQVSVVVEVDEPTLIGCHWKPKTNQTCLYQSASDENHYFFQFTNAEYARINEITTVGFNATIDELELLYQSAVKVYDEGKTIALQIGEHDLMIVKDKWLSFHFSKQGEINSYFIVNKKQLENLFGKRK